MNISINNQTGSIIAPKTEKAIIASAEKLIESLGNPHESYTVNAHRMHDDNHINLTMVHHIGVLVVDELPD